MGLFNKNKVLPLPPNRFIQFFTLIKENFILLFYTSITHFIFSLPLIYILLSTYIRYKNLLNNSATSDELFKTLLSGGLLIIPTMFVLSIATVGMHNIIKKISYNEAAQYKDFFIGIKENLLNVLRLLIIDSIVSGIVVVNYGSYLFADINVFFKLIILISSIILFFIIKIIKPFYMTQSAIFDNNKINLLKNSFTFTMFKFVRNIGIFLLSNLLIILIFLLPEQMRVINMVILIILGGAYNILVSHLNSLSILDQFIDKEAYQTIYHKGLIDYYKKEDKNE